jgi:hypothetical protein
MKSKERVAFVNEQGIAFISIEEVIRLLEMTRKDSIKDHKRACKRYLQNALDTGEDVNIRATQKMWSNEEKNLSNVFKITMKKFEVLNDVLIERWENSDER